MTIIANISVSLDPESSTVLGTLLHEQVTQLKTELAVATNTEVQDNRIRTILSLERIQQSIKNQITNQQLSKPTKAIHTSYCFVCRIETVTDKEDQLDSCRECGHGK